MSMLDEATVEQFKVGVLIKIILMGRGAGRGKEGRGMRIFRRRWFQIFVSGLVSLFMTEQVLVSTSNPNYIPSVILLGAFLVPVTYLYERLPRWEVELPSVAGCFLWGGVLGTVVAGPLEYALAVSLDGGRVA